jgi:hypothetical protein
MIMRVVRVSPSAPVCQPFDAIARAALTRSNAPSLSVIAPREPRSNLMEQLPVDFGCDLVAILEGNDDGTSPRSAAAGCDNCDLPLVGSHHPATRFSRSSPTTAAIGRPNAADIGISRSPASNPELSMYVEG